MDLRPQELRDILRQLADFAKTADSDELIEQEIKESVEQIWYGICYGMANLPRYIEVRELYETLNKTVNGEQKNARNSKNS